MGVGLGDGVGAGVGAAVGSAVSSGLGAAVSTSPRTAPSGLEVAVAAVSARPPVATTNPIDTTKASPNSASAAAVAAVTVRVGATRSTGAATSPTDPRR